MATVNYTSVGVNRLAKPDVAVARYVEFDVDFSKVTAAAGDDVVLGYVPKGSIVIAGAATVVDQAGAAATYTLRVGTTAVSAALTGNAAVDTIAGNALTGALVVAAEAAVNVLVGAQPASGKAKFVLLVSEAVKPKATALAARDQSVA